jgi:hypothetical protein
MERFNVKKLNEVECKKRNIALKSKIGILALDDLGGEVEINSAWEMIRENTNILNEESGLL